MRDKQIGGSDEVPVSSPQSGLSKICHTNFNIWTLPGKETCEPWPPKADFAQLTSRRYGTSIAFRCQRLQQAISGRKMK